MITRKLTAFCAAIFLVTISEANASRVDTFCGDRYCGQSNEYQVYKQSRTSRTVSYERKAIRKEKKKIRVQVASIGAELTHEAPSPSGLVAQAEQYLGQTASQIGVRSTLWCSAFIRKITGASGVDDRAISWLNKPRASQGCIGCIAVMRHHVGIVKGYSNGNPIIVSGNHRRRVGIGTYSRSRVLAYVNS